MARKKVGAYIDEDLAEKMRDLAHWERITFSDAVEEAFRTLIDKKEQTRGSPYSKRPNKALKTGRPI